MTDSRHLLAYALIVLMVFIAAFVIQRLRRAAGRSRRRTRTDTGGH